MQAPERYVQWMNANIGFNPRAQQNSNALSKYILDDLRFASPKAIDELVRSENLVSRKNADVSIGLTVRNVDLVLLEEDAPALSVQLSVENKTIMAAHGKARKNRYGDILHYSGHMHNHRPDCVAGALVVINTSGIYKNPDGFAQNLLRPKFNMEMVVKATVNVFESIPLRDTPDDPKERPEALAVILVDYDGENPARLVPSDPTSKMHYDSFIKRLVAKFEARFCQ